MKFIRCSDSVISLERFLSATLHTDMGGCYFIRICYFDTDQTEEIFDFGKNAAAAEAVLNKILDKISEEG